MYANSLLFSHRCDGLYRFHYFSHTQRSQFKEARDEHIRFGYITAEDLDGDSVSYAKQASEGVCLSINGDGRRKPTCTLELKIIGTDFAKGREKIHLGLELSDVLKLQSVFPQCAKSDVNFDNVTIKFLLKYSYFNLLKRAVDCLSNEVIESKLIINDCLNFFEEYGYGQSTSMEGCVKELVKLDKGEGMLHNPQMFALHRILNCDSSKAPVLIVGSFGTGKTRLLARAAYQILHNDKKAKVLVCAHHQKSVDVMLENYFGKMIEAGWNFGHLVRLVPEGSYRCNPQYAMYYQTIKQLKDLRFEKKYIRLVLTTFSSSLSLSSYLKDHFTHILLDEGAQTREPESIIPLCLASENTKIVIAGDHMQVCFDKTF